MIRKSLLAFTVCFWALSNALLLAQWEMPLDKSVSWFQISPTGNLILGTDAGIVGLDETTGKQLYALPNIPAPREEEFQVIPNTPFGMITRGEGKMQTKYIFKLNDGKVLFDSQKEKIVIGKQYLLGSTGDFLMQGMRGMESSFFLVDISTGNIRWELKDVFGKGFFAEVIDGSPIETPDGHFIVPTTGGREGGALYCLSAANGQQIWKAALPKAKGAQTTTVTETKLVVSYLEKDKFIYMKGQTVMAYNLQTGAPLWAEPAKQRGLPDLVIYDPVGLIVASAVDPNNNLVKPTMAMYDYKTGKDLWAEQVKLKGTVTNYNYCDKGIIVSMLDAGGNSLINIVDIKTGVWAGANFYKVNGTVAEMQLLGSAVYVRTNLEEDLVSLETGKSILPKNISAKSDQPLVNVRSGDLSFTFNPADGMLYRTDLKAQKQTPLVPAKIVFEQKEMPGHLEIINEMLVLSSSQTVAGYGFDGQERFKTHIPAPGISGWKKALYAASAFLNTMDAMRYAELEANARAAAANANTVAGRQMCDAIGQFANKGASVRLSAAAAEMDMIKKRFKASAAGNDIQFVLGKLENKDFALIGISKLTGAKTGEINFGKDKEPRYLLDDVSKVIYYLTPGNSMKAIRY
jgi:outer membrane protein assembly factor BamB